MASAGRILIIPRGTYDAASAYENLDLVFYNGNSWLCKKACTGVTPSDTNAEYWHRFTDVDIAEGTVAFTPAVSRTNLASGDKVSVAFGKISKWFADMKSAAYAEVANDLTVESEGKVLDARQGKILGGRIGVLTNLFTTAKNSLVAAVNELFQKIGNLDNLTTNDKSSLVAALNEQYGTIIKFTRLTIAKENVSAEWFEVDYSSLDGKNLVTSFLLGVSAWNTSADITKLTPNSSSNLVTAVYVEASRAQKIVVNIGVLHTD